MSSTAETDEAIETDENEQERHRQLVREEYDSTVVVRFHRGSSTRYHLPATDDDPEPLCNLNPTGGSGWQTKPLSVYPPGFKELCQWCQEEVADE